MTNGAKAEAVPAGAEPTRGAYPVRGGGLGSARVGGRGVFAPAQAGGRTAPLGRARARDARDLHHHPAGFGSFDSVGRAVARRGVSPRLSPGLDFW